MKLRHAAALAMVLIGLFLVYYGHFIGRTDNDAAIAYGIAAFLAYAAGRKYFDQPVFETGGGKILAVAAACLFLGLFSEPADLKLIVVGAFIGCAGFAVYGMEIKEKELRKRARLLGIEELMFPQKQ